MSSTMLKYLSPGSRVKPAVAPVTPRPKGRPKTTPTEGDLSLGEKRPRVLSSKTSFEAEQERKETHQRLELLEHVLSQGPVEERMEQILRLQAQTLHDNKQLRGLLLRRSSSSSNEFETPERPTTRGQRSPGLDEVPMEVCWDKSAAEKAYGMLGDCEEANLGAKLGGELGNCLSARVGGKKAGQHTPEVLEICRKAGQIGGEKGREWGCYGGRPKKIQTGSASASAQKGMRRPLRWEPQVGHRFHALSFIRKALKTRGLGKFTKKENNEEEGEGKNDQLWEEPHEDDVPDEVWVQIRDGGFGKEMEDLEEEM